MSRINGEKARAALQKRRRTAMREKSRVLRAEMPRTAAVAEEAKPAAKPAKAAATAPVEGEAPAAAPAKKPRAPKTEA